MPAYKDKAGKWYCKFYFEDYEGVKRQKLKRGFELKRDAEAWERDFLQNSAFQPTMPFSAFYELYCKDVNPSLRQHTIQRRYYQVKNRIMPFFADMAISSITAQDIRKWQNSLIEEGFKTSYLKNLHGALSAIFNHAVKFYRLRMNPCKQAGQPKGDGTVEPMKFWTLEEYKQAREVITDTKQRAALSLAYWSGIRKGEMLALDWGDFDASTGLLNVDKSYQRLKGKEVITATKTEVSRKILLPAEPVDDIKAYASECYSIASDEKMFPYERRLLENVIKAACRASGVKSIRVHDLRHSHASLLINMGVNIALISKRLGHEKISTTLDTYSHLFPDEENKAVEWMNELAESDTNLILKNPIAHKKA